MAGKSKYSTYEIVSLFRCITNLFHNNPELLNIEGVFRVAGSKSASEELLNQLIQEQFNWELLKSYVSVEDKINSDHVHNILGMCNCVLKDTILLSATDALLSDFSKELNGLLNSESEINTTISEAAELFNAFISKLLLSESIEHQRVGELLYHYSYLMHKAASYKLTNKMDSRNLALIMAPHFITKLELLTSKDLLALTEFTMAKLTPVLDFYIASDMASNHFTQQHVDKLEHLINTRKIIISKLSEMKNSTIKQTVEPMKELMIKSSVLANQIIHITNQLSTELQYPEQTRQLKEKLKQLQLEVKELDLEIITIRDQIKALNNAHANIFDKINKLSLSIANISYLSPPALNSNLEQTDQLPSSSSSSRLQFGIFRESDVTIALEEGEAINDTTLN